MALAKKKTDDKWTYKFKGKPADKQSDCTQFLAEVLAAEFGRVLTPAESNFVNIVSWNAETVQAVVNAAVATPEKADRRLDGAVHAIVVEAKKGEYVAPDKAAAGDVVQYWMKGGDGKWFGHCGVISSVSAGGYAELIGAHETKGPDGHFGRSNVKLNLKGDKRRVAIARIK